MRGRASEFEVVVVQSSSTQRMSPPSLTRPKSNASLATIVVDVGSRGEPDKFRLKSNSAMDSYSPAKKPNARPEPVSRIHFIPLLMVLVFFILWTASSEVLPEGRDAMPKLLVMKMDPSIKLATSKEQMNDEISEYDSRTVLSNHGDSSHNSAGHYARKSDGSHSLEHFRPRKRSSGKSTYMRGTAR